MTSNKLLTLWDAARLAHVLDVQVWRWIQAGRLQATRAKTVNGGVGKWVIDPDVFARFLKERVANRMVPTKRSSK